MNPQQDYLGPTHNPYDFIMNPGKPPKRHLSGLDPFIGKILLVLGCIFVVMVFAAIIINATAGKKTSVADLVGLVQTQQEIIRVANEGESSAVQQVTKNLAITTQFSVISQQTALIGYLSQHGTKVDDKQLALKQDASTDQKLQNAKDTSTFDDAFSQIIETELRNYANTANKLFATGNSSVQALMSADYQQAQLLISQVPITRSSIQGAEN